VEDAWLKEERVPHTFEDTQWTLRARATPGALDVAEYVAAFVIRHFRFCWDHRRGRAKPAARADFINGLHGGLWSALDDERRAVGGAPAAAEAPALSEEELARLEEEAARRPRPKPLPAAYLRGFALGRDTRIRKPLGGRTEKTNQTLPNHNRPSAFGLSGLQNFPP
jgi:hypothetical protein